MTPMVLALDTLIDDTEVEEKSAAGRGWQFQRWDGGNDLLLAADAVVHVTTRVDQDLITRLARCRVIGRFGTGIDTVDLQAAAAAGMTVVRVRDYCTPELTAHTVALALHLARLRGMAVEKVPDAGAGWSSFRQAHPLRGDLTAHVVGYGAAGASVAAALRALHIEPVVTTRHGGPAARAAGFDVVSWDDGLSVADLVLLHVDLSDQTRGIFGPKALNAVRPGALVINTARLELTDEETLALGIELGTLGGIGLDARLPPASPLRRVVGRPEVVITPHVGWYSEASLARLRRAGVEDSITAYERAETHENGRFAAKEVKR